MESLLVQSESQGAGGSCSLPPFTLGKAQEQSKNVLHTDWASPMAPRRERSHWCRAEISTSQGTETASIPFCSWRRGKTSPWPSPFHLLSSPSQRREVREQRLWELRSLHPSCDTLPFSPKSTDSVWCLSWNTRNPTQHWYHGSSQTFIHTTQTLHISLELLILK